MTKVTLELIASGSSLKRFNKETLNAYANRITHTTLGGLNIELLENLNYCHNLSILYLYDNQITNIQGLDTCINLTRLYLQNNQIQNIQGLENLVKLQFLNLRCNQIQTVQGLNGLESLEILHLDKQTLTENQSLTFEKDCFNNLNNLKSLTLTFNRIEKIDELRYVTNLETLDLSNNSIESIAELDFMLEGLENLQSISVKQNPLKNLKLRQRMILIGHSLNCINDKEVTDTEREFTVKMSSVKPRKKREPSDTSDRIQLDVKPIPHLPPYATQYRDLMLQQMQTLAIPKPREDC
ncbi:hypothetical protein BC833DRAFT_608295 [Globomyces pollinis-pini]|nr:hypothetical protein BC833DRAFT_608295 [Globomyces pollinis-pini]